VEKGCRKMNIVQILYIYACRLKMIAFETTPKVGGGEENDGGGGFKYDISDIL
jgi:hypothetical protein